MAQQQQQPITENRNSFLDADYVSEWLSANRQNLLYGVALGFLVLMLVYFFSYRNAQLTETEYQKAANDFIVFSRPTSDDTTAQDDALRSLLSIMSQHSDLQAAYGGSIAQTLINRGSTTEALPLAQQTLTRVKDNNLPFYESYGQTTLLILQQKYDAALANAQELQTQMDNENKTIVDWKQRSFSPDLFPINLFRIGMLQQQLGDKAAELATWNLWNQYVKQNSGIDSRSFYTVIQQLRIGTSNLPEYINERIKILNK